MMMMQIEERERLQKEAQNHSHDEKPDEGMTAEARARKEEEELKNCEERIAEHERIFRIIKDATGVSDVNLVIQKFLTQEDTHRNLETLVDEGQAKIDALTRERNTVRHQVWRRWSAQHGECDCLTGPHESELTCCFCCSYFG